MIDFKKAKSDFSILIFGASGSLAKLKLFPALYELALEKRLPKNVQIVGYARSQMTPEAFKNHFESAVREAVEHVDEAVLKAILKRLLYVQGAYDSPADFEILKTKLKSFEGDSSPIRLAYFSVPPEAFAGIFKCLGKVNFNTKKSALRLVIEKPFGHDLASAQSLKKTLRKNFKEDQIYLLDHYLGKEAVSNLLSLRYANSILSTLLCKDFVSSIQISALEEKGIEGRANYFDQVGVMRDMVQSHLLQVLAYLTMHAPLQENTAAIHREKIRLLKSLKADLSSVVRGQYKNYTKEKGVPKHSMTETYAALKLSSTHPLWKGVPIFLRTGKALKKKWTGVVIEFKKRRSQRQHGNWAPNRLVIQLQPFEKIEFHLLTKLGGQTFDFHELTTGRPIYCSGDCLSEHGRLLLDVVEGSQDLFLNFEEIFASWRVIDPLQSVCEINKKEHCTPHLYDAKNLGPKEADEMIKKEGFEWFNPEN